MLKAYNIFALILSIVNIVLIFVNPVAGGIMFALCFWLVPDIRKALFDK